VFLPSPPLASVAPTELEMPSKNKEITTEPKELENMGKGTN
jgi:hypothetical protein